MKKFRIIKFKSKPILTAKSISKSFSSRIVLRKIDIHLNQGEMLGLLGSNGAGKSTFMNIVLGLLTPDFGDIFLDNSKLTSLAIHERSKLGIAYLPQQTSIFRGLTVYENLLAIAQIVKKRETEQKEIVEKLLNEFNLQHLRSLNTSVLSGGEVRRLQIARTLINNPKVILLDEPMAALDPIIVQDIQKFILKLQSYGCGVMITDHQVQNLFAIVDRAYVIGEHTIIADGKPKDILKSTKARELYFGSFDS